ncbi:glycosyltransferase family A protein [Akkermansia muciniphila]|uniref:glycosyltransferase family A protein n=1 Tax=Akkermansia muciniphila TaxID=239935 RepID=UPI0019694532|nr:glycosyltransferase family A protein [Akkermansia muciniphila]
MNPSEFPSISIILTGHNEESSIRDAIRSVFGQDYEGPVEIILSDDGSSDGTFAVMQEMAAQYRGPYRVILNRNETPLGRGPHIRQAVGLASHEWILRQDGDDCSFPWRCRLFAWAVMERPDAVAMVSQMTSVYEEPGIAFEFPAFPAAPRERPAVVLQAGAFSSSAHYGGSMMIRKSACEWGSSLRMTASFEDDLMGFHAWLQGNIYEMPGISLYYYRFALKNICAVNSAFRFADMRTAAAFEKRELEMKSQLKKSKEAGLELCGELLEGLAPVFRSREELLAEMEERRKIIDSIDRQQNWWSYPFRRRWALRRPGWMGIVHCLPQKLYLFCMVFFFKLRKVKRAVCGARQDLE